MLAESGTVKVRLPGSKRFRTLAEGEQLPVGTIVDTLKGRVTLVAGGRADGRLLRRHLQDRAGQGRQAADHAHAGREAQLPEGGQRDRGGQEEEAAAVGRRRAASSARRASTARRPWSAPRWLVEDRCKSTLTRVVRGRVSVRDFVKKKTVIVRAGKKYVAKPGAKLANLARRCYHGAMAQFGMHEAKTKLSQLVERAEAGEEIVIARNGKPVARLVPVARPNSFAVDPRDLARPGPHGRRLRRVARRHRRRVRRSLRLLLDTHAALWWLSDDERLGEDGGAPARPMTRTSSF